MSHRLVAGALIALACGPKQPPPDPSPKGSRTETENRLRLELEAVPGDACAKTTWLTDFVARSRGLDAEVGTQLLAEQQQRCRLAQQYAADGAPGDAGPPGDGGDPGDGSGSGSAAASAPVDGACSRARAEVELKRAGQRAPTPRGIEITFARCFQDRIKACQLALDADVDEGLACWKAEPWPDVPEGTPPDAVDKTAACLGELRAVVADLRACAAAKKPKERDACISRYVGYVPQKCPLLDPDRGWRLFPASGELARLATAAAQRAAENQARIAKETADREAKIAKETERCSGLTTLEYAERLKAQPGPRTPVASCRYEVHGRVVSSNNVFVQLADSSGALIFLIRTREVFTEGQSLGDRTATLIGIEEAELADGSKRGFAVFKLDPPPKPKK